MSDNLLLPDPDVVDAEELDSYPYSFTNGRRWLDWHNIHEATPDVQTKSEELITTILIAVALILALLVVDITYNDLSSSRVLGNQNLITVIPPGIFLNLSNV